MILFGSCSKKKKKLGFSQLLGGGGQDQSCENSQLFFSNENLPYLNLFFIFILTILITISQFRTNLPTAKLEVSF